MTPEEWAEKAVPCQPHSGRVMTFAHVVRQEVAAAIRDAVAEEREACARLADEAEQRNLHGDEEDTAPEHIAAAIRARKEP